jgi:hypothetical protein
MKSHRLTDELDRRARRRCAEMLPVNVLLEDDDVRWLQEQAQAHQTTVSVVVRRLFRQLRTPSDARDCSRQGNG